MRRQMSAKQTNALTQSRQRNKQMAERAGRRSLTKQQNAERQRNEQRIIIRLAPRAGKMNQILRCDWLPERER